MAQAPIHQIQILLLVSLLCVSQGSDGGVTATPLQEYEKWLQWNARNHKQYLQTSVSFSDHRTDGVAESLQLKDKVLDAKLQFAEMNPIQIVVNSIISNDTTNSTDAEFRTISEAIDSIPLHNSRRVVIQIRPGTYREKIHIPKTKGFITLMGDPTDPAIITGNDTASVFGGDGTVLKTFHSATVAVDADYFIALNIIFQNTAVHEIGTVGEQGVALRISGNKAAFYSCSFYGYQDTLYDHKGLHYFQDCFIQGSVDFIFGYARSLYQNCTLNWIGKKVASVTAQKRSKSSMSSGFSFKDCKVTGTASSSGRLYLGRAWGDYSRVVYSYTFLDKLVLPRGWNNWGHSSRNLKVYYGEYKCSGPGSNMSARVPWARALTDEEAQPFIEPHFVEADTWLIVPST